MFEVAPVEPELPVDPVFEVDPVDPVEPVLPVDPVLPICPVIPGVPGVPAFKAYKAKGTACICSTPINLKRPSLFKSISIFRKCLFNPQDMFKRLELGLIEVTSPFPITIENKPKLSVVVV